MSEVQKLIESGKKELAELEAVNHDLSVQKNLYTPSMLGVLMKNLQDGISELNEKEFYDEDMCKDLGGIIAKAIEAVAKTPPPKAPVVNVTNTNNIDIKPLQSIASDITQQNKNLMAALEKSNNGGGDIYRLVLQMLARQNDIVDKMVALANKPVVKEVEKPKDLKRLVAKKDGYGNFTITEELVKK